MDDGWKVVEVEPETVEVNGNGHHADGIGPTVELVPVNAQHANGNGHAAVPVNSLPRTGYGGNGYHDETLEPQQSLFSWAEFMAEGPRAQAPARHPLDVRVGADCGAGSGACRRGTLGREDGGGCRRLCGVLPCMAMYVGVFCCPESARPSPTRCYHPHWFHPSRRKRHIDFLSVFILL